MIRYVSIGIEYWAANTNSLSVSSDMLKSLEKTATIILLPSIAEGIALGQLTPLGMSLYATKHR